ncbi:Asp23/Gls24 family envelope stress response protein [Streptococcus hongkongensis]|nr:stress response regulator Gls24 [Streptococcus uberis]
MTETYIKNTQSVTTDLTSVRGELTYEDKVIEKIVGLAIEKVDGLLAVTGGLLSNIKGKLVNTDNVRDGVNVEVGKKQVAVDLDIIAEYQKHVPTIFNDIKEVVETEVKKMTDLDVVECNVNVVDIKTRAQHEQDKVTLQDKMAEAAQSTSQFTKKQVNNVKEGAENMQSEPRVK